MSDDKVPGMADGIEQRRLTVGLTPGAFAERAGLTPQGLADVRAGVRKGYSDKTRFGVARALRWPSNWYALLLDGTDPAELPDVEHPDRADSHEERITALEGALRDVTTVVAALADEVRRPGQ